MNLLHYKAILNMYTKENTQAAYGFWTAVSFCSVIKNSW